MTTFTKREISLLYYHLKFYQSLQAGIIPADTETRTHFLEAIMGKAEPETEHEKVFLKYQKSNQQKVNVMIHAWSLNKKLTNTRLDDEIF